uniref:Uncharacterized protein n=1 Tax=Anguilla anguilla TaxID=7936 RepID=A0A0E9U8V3_ANGAN
MYAMLRVVSCDQNMRSVYVQKNLTRFQFATSERFPLVLQICFNLKFVSTVHELTC